MAQKRGTSRTITVPLTLRSGELTRQLQPADFTVYENGEAQQVLSVRSIDRAPLSLAVLIQDDVVSSVGNDIKGIGAFIRRLPEGSRVMVGYLRAGSLQVRQRFTTNAERAVGALRVPAGAAGLAPYNPYVQIVEALKRFESLPTGRRAIIVVSDGADVSRGVDSSLPTQSLDLQRAINEAQRRGVAIYSIYAPTVGLTANGNNTLINNGQSSLARLSDETGGRAFFQGTSAPVSFDPFLRQIDQALSRQLALTYLSTNTRNGFRRLKIESNLADLKFEYPTGYER
ncbi:MAG: VWA domain-containing protein [Pyrinomonadaceae bacterium]|nr:VWA domain-containing protein [Pyrinomonadaceae bacterium]